MFPASVLSWLRVRRCVKKVGDTLYALMHNYWLDCMKLTNYILVQWGDIKFSHNSNWIACNGSYKEVVRGCIPVNSTLKFYSVFYVNIDWYAQASYMQAGCYQMNFVCLRYQWCSIFSMHVTCFLFLAILLALIKHHTLTLDVRVYTKIELFFQGWIFKITCW